MSSIDTNSKVCHYCNKTVEKLLKCSKCKRVKYCSKECQKAHWKDHKKDCEAANNSSHDSQNQEPGPEEIEIKKITVFDIFEEVSGACCSKTIESIALRNYILFEISKGKDIEFIKEKLRDDYKVKLNEMVKGVMYYFKEKINDRYFSSKVITSLAKIIKTIHRQLNETDYSSIIDHFFEYVENYNFESVPIFKISAFKIKMDDGIGIIFKCSQ
jgi:hypothetical protein